MAWTASEIDSLTHADELVITPTGSDGTLETGTPIWVVVVVDKVYVRAYRGRHGRWFRHALAGQTGRVEAGGVTKDVRFVDADSEASADIDAAYRTKYARYSAQFVDPMVTPTAQSATLRIEPS